MALFQRKPKRVMADAGLQEIEAFEKWLVEANVQKWTDDGYSPELLAQEHAKVKTLAANIAERMRSDYQQSKKRP